nr:MAG TPA: hypothetical protein [Caudoviricetes sp.]
MPQRQHATHERTNAQKCIKTKEMLQKMQKHSKA